MNVIIYLIIAAWVTKAAFDVCIGMLQILFGLTAALIGAGILLLILLLESFVILCKTAFSKTS